MPRGRRHVALLFGTALAMVLPGTGQCQRTGSAVVRVVVRQSDGAAVPDADVVVFRDGTGAIAAARSDSGGVRSLTVEVDDTSRYSLVVRKIGFARVARPLALRPGDTVPIAVVLERTPEADLPAVKVETRGRSYRLTAAEIAQSGRNFVDAFDLLRKFRPEMLGDRARCPKEPTRNVWVNGKRVWWTLRQGNAVTPARSANSRVHVIGSPFGGAGPIDDVIESVLRTIKIEHIAEIRYVNCWDTAFPENGMNNAVFIDLKPGVGWDWKNGSHT
jgi:carboxypeptidase family protein